MSPLFITALNQNFQAAQQNLGTPTLIGSAAYTLVYTDLLLHFFVGSTITMDAVANPGRRLQLLNLSDEAVVSASANVVPRTGGSPSTAVLPAIVGSWATIVSDGQYWNIEGSSSIHGGDASSATVIATGSITPRTLADRFADSYTPLDFGAVGDGITDDTVAVQAAITASYNKTLTLPTGRTFIASHLTITNSIRIAGGGSLKRKAGAGSIPGDDPHFIVVSGTAKTFIFDGITIDGNGANLAASNNSTSILLQSRGAAGGSPTTYDFQSCRFINCGYGGDIYEQTGNIDWTTQEYIRVNNCSFLGGLEGVTVQNPTGVTIGSLCWYLISNNIFDLTHEPTDLGKTGIAISVDGHTSLPVVGIHGAIIGNLLNWMGRDTYDPTHGGLGSIDLYSFANVVTIVGNVVYNCVTRAIQTKCDAETVIFANNVAYGQLVSNGDGHFIINPAYDKSGGRMTIASNISNGALNRGITASLYNQADGPVTNLAKDVMIVNNQVYNAGTRAIDVGPAFDVTVSGNIIDTAPAGITFGNVTRQANVKDNQIKNITTTNAIWFANTCSGAIVNVKGNDIVWHTGATKPIEIDAALGGMITDNTITGMAASIQQPIILGAISGLLIVKDNYTDSVVTNVAQTGALTNTNMHGAYGLGNEVVINTAPGGGYAPLPYDFVIINNDSASALTIAFPSASNYPNREFYFLTVQNRAISATGSVVIPRIGGAAGTAIVTGTAGNWAKVRSNGTSWRVIAGS